MTETEVKLQEKIGDKSFTRAQLIATEKFGEKKRLKDKFYQSILEGFTDIKDLWISDDVISSLKNKIDKASDENKEKVILEILDTYDSSVPEVKQLLKKYNRYLKNIISK